MDVRIVWVAGLVLVALAFHVFGRPAGTAATPRVPAARFAPHAAVDSDWVTIAVRMPLAGSSEALPEARPTRRAPMIGAASLRVDSRAPRAAARAAVPEAPLGLLAGIGLLAVLGGPMGRAAGRRLSGARQDRASR